MAAHHKGSGDIFQAEGCTLQITTSNHIRSIVKRLDEVQLRITLQSMIVWCIPDLEYIMVRSWPFYHLKG